jgi:hypothetical protein
MAESSAIWIGSHGGRFVWWEENDHLYCEESNDTKTSGFLYWAFLDRGHTRAELLAELNEVWPRIIEGGVLAGHDYRDPNWPEVTPTVHQWASKLGLKVEFAPPHAFWIQKPGGMLPRFHVWHQPVETYNDGDDRFNPSICPHPTDKFQCVLAFRRTKGRWEEARIGIGLVDAQNFQFLVPPQILDLGPASDNYEDPRIYLWEGEIWLSYAVSNWETGTTLTSQNLVPLELDAEGRWQLAGPPTRFTSPFLRPQEKNWIFFPRGRDQLFVLYSSAPEWRIHQIFEDETDAHVPAVVAPGISWPFGEIRGGTPFFEAPNGRLWSFFHSGCLHDPAVISGPISYYAGVFPESMAALLAPERETWDAVRPHGRYFCGLVEVDPETLLPTRMTKLPLLYQTPPSVGRVFHHVIWPAGAFRVGDVVTLAYGLDDRACRVARFSGELLEKLLDPV